MQHNMILGTACAVLLGATAIAFPQDQKPMGDKPAPRADQPVTPASTPSACKKGSEVLGATVRDAQYEKIGKVEDLVLDPATGKIEFAVLSLEDKSAKNKWFAVPFEKLDVPTPMAGGSATDAPKPSAGTEFTLRVDPAKLQGSPGFPKDKWPDVNSPAWRLDLERQFGGSSTGPTPRGGDVIIAHHSTRLSQLLEQDLYTKDDKSLGEIDEIAVDPNHDRIAFVVVSTGGFLGLGDTMHAIPWASVQAKPTGGKDQLVVDVTKERLTAAPKFEKDQWSRMSESAWITDLEKYYGVDSRGGKDAQKPMPGGTTKNPPKPNPDGNDPH